MQKELPKIKKSLGDFAPSQRDIVGRIMRAGTKTLVVALSLLGIHAPSWLMSTSNPAQSTYPTITNRRERTETSTLVLELAETDQDQSSLLAHRSHRSHSSHRSHYSSATSTRTTTKSTKTEDDQLLVNAKKLSGIIIEVQSAKEKEYFILKDGKNSKHTIYYKDTTKVRVISPTDITTTIETLKTFSGSVPFKVNKTVLVHWKTQESKKVALLITLFEL